LKKNDSARKEKRYRAKKKRPFLFILIRKNRMGNNHLKRRSFFFKKLHRGSFYEVNIDSIFTRNHPVKKTRRESRQGGGEKVSQKKKGDHLRLVRIGGGEVCCQLNPAEKTNAGGRPSGSGADWKRVFVPYYSGAFHFAGGEHTVENAF